MIKKRKKGKEETKSRKYLLKSVRSRMELFEKAMNGDADATMECAYKFGMCSKASLDDYYQIKKQYGDKQDEE